MAMRKNLLPSFAREPRPLNLSALSILVIDDQPFFRVLLTEVLRTLGVGTVTVATDGEDGYAAFHDIRPDIVVTDWMMPKLNGIELTRRIRGLSDEALQKVPVILVTAKSERSQIESARSAGIDEFILKPISAKGICDCLREVVEKPRAFVTFDAYTGPCRRRRVDPNFSGPYRRFNDPIEINDSDEVLLKQGLRSVFAAALARVSELNKGLQQSNANIRPIHEAVLEMQAIAEDISDTHLARVCQFLSGYVVAMYRSSKMSPDLIQTHLKALDLIVRTPLSQIKSRDEIVAGLERMMKRPDAA